MGKPKSGKTHEVHYVPMSKFKIYDEDGKFFPFPDALEKLANTHKNLYNRKWRLYDTKNLGKNLIPDDLTRRFSATYAYRNQRTFIKGEPVHEIDSETIEPAGYKLQIIVQTYDVSTLEKVLK